MTVIRSADIFVRQFDPAPGLVATLERTSYRRWSRSPANLCLENSS